MPRGEKGKFIKAGRGPGRYKPGSRAGLIAEVVGIPVCIGFFAIAFFMSWAGTGFSLTGDGLFMLFLFMVSGSGLIWLPFVEGGSIDAIYENGLTVRHAIKLSDVCHGRHWIPWHEITRIEYGMTKGLRHGYYRDSGYFRIFTPTGSAYGFKEIEYHCGEPVEFYGLLWQKLHENCRDAEWVKRDIPEGQWTGRPEICR